MCKVNPNDILDLKYFCSLVNEQMIKPKRRKNLIDAYSYVRNKTKNRKFTYEEVKDYLFHHPELDTILKM